MKTYQAIIAATSLVFAVLLGGCSTCPAGWGTKSIAFDNSYFYDKEGKFVESNAKDAYIALMKYHGCPVYPGTKEKMWVSDYGTGQFAKLGLGCVSFVNEEKDHYMMMDLYLLPNQMLPEHWHLECDKQPAKLEGWLVRYGQSHIVGIGEPNLGKDVVVPQCHMNGTVTTKHEVVCNPGEFAKLAEVKSRHWQLAGGEGAIITEVANVHCGGCVRHSDQGVNNHFLGK